MFTASKNPPAKVQKKQAPARDANAVTILTSGCHFSGKLYCRGASRIGGKIDGQIISEGQLIVEEEAIITAEIKADEVVIQGRVQGSLIATGRVELTACSQFDGDISTPTLIVREGAQFNGHSKMMKREDAQAKNPKIVSMSGGKQKNEKSPDVGPSAKDVAVMKVPEVHAPA